MTAESFFLCLKALASFLFFGKPLLIVSIFKGMHHHTLGLLPILYDTDSSGHLYTVCCTITSWRLSIIPPSPRSRFPFFFFFLLTTLHGLQDLSSPSRDLTRAPQWKWRVLTTGQPGNSSLSLANSNSCQTLFWDLSGQRESAFILFNVHNGLVIWLYVHG